MPHQDFDLLTNALEASPTTGHRGIGAYLPAWSVDADDTPADGGVHVLLALYPPTPDNPYPAAGLGAWLSPRDAIAFGTALCAAGYLADPDLIDLDLADLEVGDTPT